MSRETETEEALRDSLSSSGFVEQSTYVLTSSEKHVDCVRIKNPVSTEYNALRSALLPKLLETLERNTHVPYPQKIFEIGEVVVKHDGKALTQKRLSAITSHSQASLSEIAGALDNAIRSLGKTMKLHSKKDARFIEGRCASVSIDGKEIGSIGELHPTILEKIQVQMPCAAFEITV
jgi:phenylalanyl-tRNA synthetase beta chain